MLGKAKIKYRIAFTELNSPFVAMRMCIRNNTRIWVRLLPCRQTANLLLWMMRGKGGMGD